MPDKSNIIKLLSDNRNEQGFWDGELSSSALAVSVSVISFHFYNSEQLKPQIRKGLHWLTDHINKYGGFGDSPESLSNISTSLLCYSALHVTKYQFEETVPTINLLSEYLKKSGIDVNSQDIAKHILDFYKKDFTFSVPILATCALCGIPANDPFNPIPQLPFELALMPAKFYRFLNLNVVSYAIPALVAVGIAIFKNKSQGTIMKSIRSKSVPKVLSLLEKIMPQSGGFLEAIPLTAFVSLSLIKSGYRDHITVEKGIEFLKRTQREDGSWPIDINLSTWVTTLAVKALKNNLDSESGDKITNHLLSIQNKTIHPFNGSVAGGWGWTNYSGSVPDGDDTPGAILSLLFLNPELPDRIKESLIAGCDWLIQLQNKDGGFPTFSRGWGKLPFDQSCADLTGHAVLAIATLIEKADKTLNPSKRNRYIASIRKAIKYLKKNQKSNGAWLPLWFGNQHHPKHYNPVYGSARVTTYLNDTLACKWIDPEMHSLINEMIRNSESFLLTAQNTNGSWGGDTGIEGTIEETALAISALSGNTLFKSSAEYGMDWLKEQEEPLKASPIGLYFASLWYDEKLYPLVMCLEAIERYNK